MRVDGNGSVNFDTYTSRDSTGADLTGPEKERFGSLQLTVQYFVVRGLALGVTGTYERSSYSRGGDSISGSGHGYALGPSLTWFPARNGGNLLPYVQVAGTWGRSSSTSHYTYSYPGTAIVFDASTSYRTSSYAASAGVILMFARYVGADVALEYFDDRTRGSETESEGYPSSPAMNTTVRIPLDFETSGVRLRLGLAVFVRP